MRLFSRLCPSLRDLRPTPRLPPRHLQVRPAAAPTPTPAAPAGIDPHPGTSSSGTAAAPRPLPLRGAGRELEMPRDRDVPAAVRVYTVCDESRYLIVRNVPSLGCGDDLASLFGTYGPVEECTPMDAEDCEPYTDVFFVKFSQVNNARFAKRKLDESVFLGNRLQVTYAPQFESPLDTKEKLEVRRKEVLGRIKSSAGRPEGTSRYSPAQGSSSGNHLQMNSNKREYMKTIHASHIEDPRFSHVPSDKDYFPSESMNSTVKLVREKLDKIQSGGDNSSTSAASKKPRVDNRRRI